MTCRLLSLVLLMPAALAAQSRPDLYRCEGCEAIHERDLQNLPSRAVIPPAGEPGEPMVLVGRVFRLDGKTPARGVVVYAYHTNARGIYPPEPGATGWGRRHGYLRAWVKTDSAGNYRFDTIRPAPYPGRSDPAHVHLIVKEPERREYWIDEIVFTDDLRVTPAYRAREQGRGGSGIVTPAKDRAGVWQVRRDIVLEP
ncbi:MAG: dioxygenase family protein [Gemmatimonadales bacterium]